MSKATGKKGKSDGKGTFLVRIKFQQHSSWQGEVYWAEKQRRCCFRSELELIRLINSALGEDEVAVCFQEETPQYNP